VTPHREPKEATPAKLGVTSARRRRTPVRLAPVTLRPLLSERHEDAVRALASLLSSALRDQAALGAVGDTRGAARDISPTGSRGVLDELSPVPDTISKHRAAAQHCAA
jgi:hypothetical protein